MVVITIEFAYCHKPSYARSLPMAVKIGIMVNKHHKFEKVATSCHSGVFHAPFYTKRRLLIPEIVVSYWFRTTSYKAPNPSQQNCMTLKLFKNGIKSFLNNFIRTINQLCKQQPNFGIWSSLTY